MILRCLVSIGLIILIATPIILLGMFASKYVISELWVSASTETAIVQNSINGFFDSLANIVLGNWFTIFIVSILIVITYILAKIYYELRYKNIANV